MTCLKYRRGSLSHIQWQLSHLEVNNWLYWYLDLILDYKTGENIDIIKLLIAEGIEIKYKRGEIGDEDKLNEWILKKYLFENDGMAGIVVVIQSR